MSNFLSSLVSAFPQTQCRLCGYDDCLDYAKSIADSGETINKCQPGGERTVQILSDILSSKKIVHKKEFFSEEKKINGILIRESECIGCIKCMKVCPVDAILGGVKKVHSVLLDACNGCNLCIAVCPVDCISVIEHPDYKSPFEIAEQSINRYRLKKRNNL